MVVGADLDAAKREIGLVASEFPNVHDAVRRTCEMAPLSWYATYNLEFRPKLENHFEDILAERESVYGAPDMLERLDDAVLDYPASREFVEHRETSWTLQRC